MESSPEDDPWEWSVDQVVQALCGQEGVWTHLTANPVVPERGSLEHALRENAIDGMNLLTNIDSNVLSKELGIAVFGQRGTMMHAIESLRARSKRYQDHVCARTMLSGVYGGLDPGTMPRFVPSGQASFYPSPRPPMLGLHQPPWAYNGHHGEPWASTPTPNHDEMRLFDGPMPWESPLIQNPPRAGQIADRGSMVSGEHSRAQPQLSPGEAGLPKVDDLETPAENGKPLALASRNADGEDLPRLFLSESHQGSQSQGEATPADDVTHLGQLRRKEASLVDSSEKKRRRVVPTLVHRDDSHEPLTGGNTASQGSLLSDEAEGVDKTRSSEFWVTEETGRKRRRLVPKPVKAKGNCNADQPSELVLEEVTSSTDTDSPRALSSVSLMQPQTGKSPPQTLQNPKLLPSQIHSLRKSRMRKKPDNRNSEGYYLSLSATPLDEIFYGNIPYGASVHDDVNRDALHDVADPGHQENFQIQAQGNGYAGLCLYVNKLIKHFLNHARPIEIRQGGRRLFALQPYQNGLARSGLHESFTLFSVHSPTEIVTTREDLARYFDGPVSATTAKSKSIFLANPSESTLTELPQQKDDVHEYDYLEKWRHVGQDAILPPLGDSGSEGDYDSDTWREMEEEKADLQTTREQQRRGVISPDQVAEAIELGIQNLIEKWKLEKLPKREPTAWSLWRKSRRTRTKNPLIRNAQEIINQINNQRLPKIRQEIAKQSWGTVQQVEKQCMIMEQSIFEREDFLWRISVLSRRSEPERPPPRKKKVIPARLPRSHSLVREDEEVLESDSDRDRGQDEEEEADDFVSEDYVTSGRQQEDAQNWMADADDESSQAMDIDGDDEVNAVLPTRRTAKSPNGELEGSNSQSNDDLENTSSQRSSPSTFISATDEPLKGTDKVQLLAKGPKFIDLTLSSDPPTADEADKKFGIKTPPTNIPENENPLARLNSSASHDEIIDLGESDSYYATDSSGGGHRASDGGDLGAYSDVDTIKLRPPAYYEHRHDRKRLLINLLERSPIKTVQAFIVRSSGLEMTSLRSEIIACLRSLRDGTGRIMGMDQKMFEELSQLAVVYYSWYECKYRTSTEGGWPRDLITRMMDDERQFGRFYNFLLRALRNYDNRDDADLDNFNGRTGDISPNKKRKRTIFENVQARNVRESGRQRLQEQEKRKRQLEKKLQTMGASLTKDPTRIMVNIGKFEDQSPIYIHPRLGRRIKKHQTEGVQFMWREIVMDDSSRQGCLLAHEMGLGKTMQVITLLVTIAEASKSSEPDISAQIPSHLKESRTLILCPSSLVDNWSDEVLMWAPTESIGNLRKLDSQLVSIQDRLGEISAWYHDGGVLIISYNKFRDLVLNKAHKRVEPRLDEGQHEQVLKHLLEGPNIIVADEAHMFKNAATGTASAASRFRSKSRIAMTGSPVANHLEEYYSMIEWIAPGYLGSPVEFRAKFKEPIEEGLYQDSTKAEIRKSLKMLRVLKKDLDPKVCRAGISVLKESLTTKKTEFVLNVPLTPLQATAYSIYVRWTLSKEGLVVANTRLWDWLAILALLCNHPACFIEKLSEREGKPPKDSKLTAKKDKPRSRRSLADRAAKQTNDPELEPGEAPISKLDVPDSLINQQLALFEKVGDDLEKKMQSHKIQLLEQILDAAAKAGDKSLIFSHRLPTLDYLECIFKKRNRRYVRLDGSTKMSVRATEIKRFNTSEDDIYLISTKAGGLGVNLPGANRVVIMDFSFNPTWEVQAIGRAYRIGQTKPVFVYRFTAGGTFEDVVYNKALFKTQLAYRVVDKVNPMRHARKNVRDYLFEPKEVAQTDLSKFRGRDPLVLDRILAIQPRDKSIRSIAEIETFLRDDDEKLTAEEEREVDEILRDEQLKRSDPAAYNKMIQERQKRQLRVGAGTGVEVSSYTPLPVSAPSRTGQPAPLGIFQKPASSTNSAAPSNTADFSSHLSQVSRAPSTIASTVQQPVQLPGNETNTDTEELAPSVLPRDLFPPFTPVRNPSSAFGKGHPAPSPHDTLLAHAPNSALPETTAKSSFVVSSATEGAKQRHAGGPQLGQDKLDRSTEIKTHAEVSSNSKPEDTALLAAELETLCILTQDGSAERASTLASTIGEIVKDVAGKSGCLTNMNDTNTYLRDNPLIRSRLMSGELSPHGLYGLEEPERSATAEIMKACLQHTDAPPRSSKNTIHIQRRRQSDAGAYGLKSPVQIVPGREKRIDFKNQNGVEEPTSQRRGNDATPEASEVNGDEFVKRGSQSAPQSKVTSREYQTSESQRKRRSLPWLSAKPREVTKAGDQTTVENQGRPPSPVTLRASMSSMLAKGAFPWLRTEPKEVQELGSLTTVEDQEEPPSPVISHASMRSMPASIPLPISLSSNGFAGVLDESSADDKQEGSSSDAIDEKANERLPRPYQLIPARSSSAHQ